MTTGTCVRHFAMDTCYLASIVANAREDVKKQNHDNIDRCIAILRKRTQELARAGLVGMTVSGSELQLACPMISWRTNPNPMDPYAHRLIPEEAQLVKPRQQLCMTDMKLLLQAVAPSADVRCRVSDEITCKVAWDTIRIPCRGAIGGVCEND